MIIPLFYYLLLSIIYLVHKSETTPSPKITNSQISGNTYNTEDID